MASSERNSRKLPDTSSSKPSGASMLTSEVSACAHPASDSRLASSARGARSKACKEAASANAVLSLLLFSMPAARALALAATTVS